MWKTPPRFVRMTASHSSNDIFASDRSRVIPALLTRMSIFPKRSRTDDTTSLGRLGIRDVTGHGKCLRAVARDLSDDVGCHVAVAGIPDGDARTVTSQLQGDGATDAARRTGHKTGPA